MTFTSLNFLFFFSAVFSVYYLIPSKFRWYFLLIVSYFFYINFSPLYAFLLLVISLCSYGFGILIENTNAEKLKINILVLSIVILLLPLFFFKYFDFVNESIFLILENFNIRIIPPKLNLILPLGISFYTFMALGYVIDVYNEEIKAEKQLGKVMLFLSFFPIVISGPIERAENMFKQFNEKLVFDFSLSKRGIQLVIWGYFMKLVIADRIGIFTDLVLGNIAEYTSATVLLASLLYPMRIYCDLGGYSLIAIGSAALLGIKIIPNFKRPFFALSMSDFWRRWHMSLIKWLTDYIYTPLTFSFRSFKKKGIVIGLLLTFLISGIWHGASFIFIVWGLFHGVLLSVEAITKSKKESIERKFELKSKWWYILFSIIFTYLLFAFSLLFGGLSSTFDGSLMILKKVFTISNVTLDRIEPTLFFAFFAIGILMLNELKQEYFSDLRGKMRLKFPTYLVELPNIIGYTILILLIIFWGAFGNKEFIYYQF